MARGGADRRNLAGLLLLLSQAACARPRAMVCLWLVLSGAGIALLPHLRVDTTIGSALNQSDASWRLYRQSVRQHGGDEFVAVTLEGKEPFDPDVLRRVLELSDRLERLPQVRRVDSLATVPLIRAGGAGELLLDPGLNQEVVDSERARRRFSEIVRSDAIAPGNLISSEGQIVALNLLFSGDVDDDREAAVSAVQEAVRDDAVKMSGVPVVRAEAGRRTREQLSRFILPTIFAIGLLIWLLLGSGRAILIGLSVGTAATLICLGVMGLSGVSLSFSTCMVPPVLLALGCAYSMHVMTAAASAGREGLTSVLRSVLPPVAISGVTTAIGFFAMGAVRIELIQNLAVFGAFGVLVVCAAAVTLAPAMCALWPIQGRRRVRLRQWLNGRGAESLVTFVARRRKRIIGFWLVAGALTGVGLARLNVASDVILWFPRDGELRRSYDYIRSKLSGITPVNVLVQSTDNQAVTEPPVLAAIAQLSEDLRKQPRVGKVLSVVDPLMQLHEVATGDQGDRLPSERDVIEQYLVLLDGLKQIDDFLNVDRTSANVLVRLDENSSDEIVPLRAWVAEWWAKYGVQGYSVATTGIMYEFARAQDEIAFGAVLGLAIAVMAICLLLMSVLRDRRLAALASVANALPIAICFGFVGLIGVPLDAATASLGSLALGIAVDDTVHLLWGIRSSERGGRAIDEAIRESFARVLPPILFTTLVVGAGFAVLAVSEISLVRNFGVITAAIVAICLLADLLLMPALLLGSRKGRG